MKLGGLTGKILLLLLVLSVVVNLVAINYLPDKIGLQVDTGGKLTNHIPKTYFLFFAPVILLLIFTAFTRSERGETSKFILIGVLIFILNGVSIFFNLRP